MNKQDQANKGSRSELGQYADAGDEALSELLGCPESMQEVEDLR